MDGPPGVLGRQFMLSRTVFARHASQPPSASPQRLLLWLLGIHTEYTIHSGERLGWLAAFSSWIPYPLRTLRGAGQQSHPATHHPTGLGQWLLSSAFFSLVASQLYTVAPRVPWCVAGLAHTG